MEGREEMSSKRIRSVCSVLIAGALLIALCTVTAYAQDSTGPAFDGSAKTVADYTELCWKYGPFFLCVFCFVIAVTFRNNADVFKRFFFIGCAFAVVAVSLFVWRQLNPEKAVESKGPYVARGEIAWNYYGRLKSEEENLYVKLHMWGDETSRKKKYRFVAIDESENFRQGQTLELSAPRYSGDEDGSDDSDGPRDVGANSGQKIKSKKARLIWEPNCRKNKYIIDKENITTELLTIKCAETFSAQAGPKTGRPLFARIRNALVRSAYAQTTVSPEDLRKLKSLSDEKTSVAAKALILRRWENITSETATNLVIAANENSLAFLFAMGTLQNYDDLEVEMLADRFMERVDLTRVLKEASISSDKVKKNVTNYLLGLEQAKRKDLLQKTRRALDDAGSRSKGEAIGRLSDDLADKPQRILYPKASRNGDRFSVRVTWDRNNPPLVECLAKIFRKEVPSDRNLEQEIALMNEMQKKNGARTVYWNSREWAIRIADRINNECNQHGRPKARFVH
jgi:hypothetical protein